MGANKLEQFTLGIVHRSEIKNADYNPRKITEEAKKKLKRFLKRKGLLGPLIWNRLTGNLVSGHQRLEQMDAIMGTDDYELTVAVVEFDNEKDEIAANIFLNNPSAQGEWDYEILTEIGELADFDFEKDFGFSKDDVDLIWGDLEEAGSGTEGMDSELFETTSSGTAQSSTSEMVGGAEESEGGSGGGLSEEERQEFRDLKAKAREKAKTDNENGNGIGLAQADYYVTVIFPDATKKREFMERLGKPAKETRITSETLFDFVHGR